MIIKATEKGQALILITLAAIGLFAFSALAIDGTRAFSDKRHAQNAADTSVLAAALAKIRGQNYTNAAIARATSNGYTNGANTTVQVNLCSELVSPDTCQGLPAGATASEYIRVRIVSTLPTTFARVIGRQYLQSAVEAIAWAAPGASGGSGSGGTGYGITSLKPSGTGVSFTGSGNLNLQGSTAANAGFSTTGSGTMHITGSVTLGGALSNTGSKDWNVGGNVWANGYSGTGSGDWNVAGSFFSDQNFTITGSGTVTTSSLFYVGSYSDTGSGWAVPWPPTHAAYQAPAVITDPFATLLNPPANPGGCTSATFVGSTAHTINPGCYTSIGVTGSGDLTLNPGIYYITGNVSMTGSGDFTANGVMLYMKTGAISLTGSGDLHISAMTSGPYAGLSVYVDRSNSSSVSFTGSGSSTFTGTIYAPASSYTLTGSGGSLVLDSQIICYASTLTGSGDLNLIYNASNNYNPIPPTPASISLVK